MYQHLPDALLELAREKGKWLNLLDKYQAGE